MGSSSHRKGICHGICLKFKLTKPRFGMGRYETGQARCQKCNIYISEEGLNPSPNYPDGELIYCKCCGTRVRKKPRGRESKERLEQILNDNTSNIPQADDLSKIVRVVELIHDDKNTVQQISRILQITPRQSQYYCKAAEILGLTKKIGPENKSDVDDETSKMSFHLTIDGLGLLKKSIEEKKADLIQGISHISLYNKFLEELNTKKSWTNEEIIKFFEEKGHLSVATAQRRSRTMVRWFSYLDLIDMSRKGITLKESKSHDSITYENNFEKNTVKLDEYQAYLIRDFYKVRKNWRGTIFDAKFQNYVEQNGILIKQYLLEWGSWKKFLEQTEDTSNPNQISLIIEYEKLKDSIGYVPSAFEMFKQGRYGLDSYKTEFGNWEDFLRLMNDFEVTKEELVKEYAIEQTQFGDTPTVSEINDFGRYRYDDYVNTFGSWNAFLQYFENKDESLPTESKSEESSQEITSKPISEEDIISDYANLKKILAKTPTIEEIQDFGEYKMDDYVKLFGSYKAFLERIGDLDKIDDQLEMELVKQYYELKESLGGKEPTPEELDSFGIYTLDDYKKVFGSLVGFQMHLDELEKGEHMTMLEKTSKEDLVSAYYRLKNKLNHIPTISELNQLCDYSHEFYRHKFGSYEHFLYLIEERKSRKVPESELIENYNSVKRILGKIPTGTDMNKIGKYSSVLYSNRFGGWNKFLLHLGEKISFKPGVDKQDLIDNFNKVKEQLNRVPAYQEMGKFGSIPVTEYFDIYGSWNRFLSSVGLETIQSQLVEENALLDNYKKIKDSLGRIPTESELRTLGKFSVSSYYDKYGSYDDFLVSIGEKDNTVKLCTRCGMENSKSICIHCGSKMDKN